MRPEVQVLPGPPLALTSGNAGQVRPELVGRTGAGSRPLTWLPFLVMAQLSCTAILGGSRVERWTARWLQSAPRMARCDPGYPGRDVGVHPEEVRRIVLGLEGGQAGPLLAGVCLTHPLARVVAGEVHVDTAAVGLQRVEHPAHPIDVAVGVA